MRDIFSLFSLNKSKCTGRNLVKDCTITSSYEKGVLLRDFYSEKSRNRSLKLLSTSHDVLNSLHCSGRYSEKFVDVVDVIVNVDYGADNSALSTSNLQNCADAGV